MFGITRETTVGLMVAGAFVSTVGGVLAYKLHAFPIEASGEQTALVQPPRPTDTAPVPIPPAPVASQAAPVAPAPVATAPAPAAAPPKRFSTRIGKEDCL